MTNTLFRETGRTVLSGRFNALSVWSNRLISRRVWAAIVYRLIAMP